MQCAPPPNVIPHILLLGRSQLCLLVQPEQDLVGRQDEEEGVGDDAERNEGGGECKVSDAPRRGEVRGEEVQGGGTDDSWDNVGLVISKRTEGG